MQLGENTFRATRPFDGTQRSALFAKCGSNEVSMDHDTGLLRLHSPVSGAILTTRDGSSHHTAVKDPISGTVLNVNDGQTQVMTPMLRQPFMRARNVYVRRDIEATIHALRCCNKVGVNTNEKVGTAGKPTGMDKSLLCK